MSPIWQCTMLNPKWISENKMRQDKVMYLTEQSTLNCGSKAAPVVTVVSPRRRQPKKVQSATAKTAAWKGFDKSVAQ